MIEDNGSDTFANTFNKMTTSNVIIELKSVQDSEYSVSFKVNLCKMNYIGDNLANIAAFDFPLIAFRFTSTSQNNRYKKEIFTTEETCQRLQLQGLITFT